MNFLPKDIENIIVDYKEEIERWEKAQPLLNEIKNIEYEVIDISPDWTTIDYDFKETIISTKKQKHSFEVCNKCGDFIGSMNLHYNNMCKCEDEEDDDDELI